MAPSRSVLWAANVRSKSLDERLAAANAGGFAHMSIFPIDYRHWTDAGLAPAEIARRAADAGVRFAIVDPYTQWVPDWRLPDGYPEDNKPFVEFGEDEVLRIAAELGADTINCVEPFGVHYEPAALIDALGGFGERAKAHGLSIGLEFMPTSGIVDLAQGWAVVSGVNADHVRLVLDTWHFVRSGSSLDLIDAALGARISEVQLVDGAREPVGDLGNDLLHFRRLPGEGDFPLAPIVDRLRETGALNSVGPEVFADAMDAISPVEAGRMCRESLDEFMKTAG